MRPASSPMRRERIEADARRWWKYWHGFVSAAMAPAARKLLRYGRAMRKYLLAVLCWLGAGGLCWATDAAAFAGRWKLDAARSSSIKPWDAVDLEISLKGDAVEIARRLTWTLDRKSEDVITVRPDDRTVTVNPLKYWVDTWFNNAYIGGDHALHVKGGWLDRGRILRVDIDLALELQQGDYPVHIYREYRLSADHRELRVYELRSTRDQPLAFIFTRA